jgi:hypothetical protein
MSPLEPLQSLPLLAEGASLHIVQRALQIHQFCWHVMPYVPHDLQALNLAFKASQIGQHKVHGAL